MACMRHRCVSLTVTTSSPIHDGQWRRLVRVWNAGRLVCKFRSYLHGCLGQESPISLISKTYLLRLSECESIRVRPSRPEPETSSSPVSTSVRLEEHTPGAYERRFVLIEHCRRLVNGSSKTWSKLGARWLVQTLSDLALLIGFPLCRS